MNYLKIAAIASLLALLSTNVDGAIAQVQSTYHAFSNPAGDTIFPSSMHWACLGKIVNYKTRSQGVGFQGSLWVQSPAEPRCDGGGGRTIKGYFEERGSDGQWCKGQLTVDLHIRVHSQSQKTYDQTDPPSSYAHWEKIEAVPGYSCKGVGTSPTVMLRVVRW